MIPETRNMASVLLAATVALLMMGSAMGLGAGLQDVDLEAPLTENQILNTTPVDAHEVLLEKADRELTHRLNEGDTDSFDVILSGHAHQGVTEDMFADREAAMQELDARAAPFFDQVEQITSTLGGEVVDSWSAAPAIKVSGDRTLLEALALLDEVTDMTLDYMGVVSLVQEHGGDVGVGPIPGDVSASNTNGRKMIQAEDIWAAGFMGEGITISIIDTGVDSTHEAFKNADGSSRIVAWANCLNGDGSPGSCDTSGSAFDDGGHGTHVAGTAAGSALYDDPQRGFFQEVGVAPRADIMAVKFLSSAGGGSFEGALSALQWSFDNGADLTSNSWGATSCAAGPGVKNLVNTLNDLGMANVFSAGNSGFSGVGSPACAEKAIAIGAVDDNENIASFSSRGPCSEPETRICPHVVAKGVDVRSAYPFGNGYNTLSGTSMSGPHVGGAVVLMEQMKQHFDGEGWDTPNLAERQMLTVTAKPLGSEHPNNNYGWGLVQLLPILAMLEDSDDANIIDSFGVSNEEVRQGESTALTFGVTNLGGATATGDFVAELERPDGSVDTFRDEEVSLGLLDGASVSETVTATGGIAPGNYTFRASFDYTWTNESGEEKSGSVSHEGHFTVIRVFLDMELDGLDNASLPLMPQNLVFTATSTGNEAAFNSDLEFTVPERYQFVPGANFDPTNENTLYADPAPDSIVERSGRIVLIWDVGDLPVGESFSFTSTVVPTIPDDYRLLSTVKYQDGADQNFGDSKAFHQTVGV